MKPLGLPNLPQKDTSTSANPCCALSSETSCRPLRSDGAIRVGGKAPAWITGLMDSPVGPVPVVSTSLRSVDHFGAFRCRVSGFRNHYSVQPGLYAVGRPTPDSEVFASANYKLSFDALREALAGVDAWVLVLDTRGINVWCAAGKKTFSSAELVAKIADTELSHLVSHRRIVVPQLAAPGVSAPLVKEQSGFTVRFGPVRARDISAYLEAGLKATPAMRRVDFPLRDRLVLTPMELVPAMRLFPWFAATVLLLFGLQPSGILFADAWHGAAPFLLMGLGAVVGGALLTPVLLPFIPLRSFALKGLVVGIVVQLLVAYSLGLFREYPLTLLIAANVFFPLAASYIALQFTGSTTFTGPTGVGKELRVGIPFYVAGNIVAVGSLLWFKLNQWGII